MQLRNLAAAADSHAVALELVDEIVGHRLAQVGAAVQQRDERAAAREPDGGLAGRVASPKHGDNGQLEAVTLKSGERLTFSFLFLFLGALPCTDWLGDVVARDDKGFILTGAGADADSLLETSLPGVFAAGDVRSGSTKRCATAVGEGAMAVQFVHGRLAEHSRAQRTATS